MYIILKIIGFFIKIIPRKISYFIFDFFSILLFYLNKKKRNTLKKNLSIVLGTKDISNDLLKNVFKNYGKYYCDLFIEREFLIPFTDGKKFLIGSENLKKYLEQYSGCIMTSLHIGNWDYGGAYLSYLFPGKINVVVERLSKGFFKWFKETREKWGMKVIESTDIKTMLKVLKNKEVLVLLVDRDLEKTGLQIDFFGKKAYIPSGPFKLALKAKVPVMFAGMLRDQKNILYYYPFYIPDDLNTNCVENENENILKLAKSLIIKMEKIIKENPEQWCMLQDIWV